MPAPHKDPKPLTTTRLWASTMHAAKVMAAERDTTIRAIVDEAVKLLKEKNHAGKKQLDWQAH